MPPAIVALLFFTGLFAASMICAIFVGPDTALKYSAGVAIVAIVVSSRRQIAAALQALKPIAISVIARIKDLGAIELIPRKRVLPPDAFETHVTQTTNSNSSATTGKPKKPRLFPCPACDHLVSDGALSCPGCGHVVKQEVKTTIKPAPIQNPAGSASEVAAIIVAIVGGFFILGCFSCMGFIGNLPRAPLEPSRYDKLQNLRHEIESDPYTTDAEFVDRLRRIDEIK